MTSLLVNMTMNQYVVYDGTKKQSDFILRELFSKITENSFEPTAFEIRFLGAERITDVGEQSWTKQDRIIYCPKNLEKYVKKNYAQLFVVPYENPEPPAKKIFEDLMKATLHPRRVGRYLSEYNYLIPTDEYTDEFL